MRLRMPKLHEMERAAAQCPRCGQERWFTYFPPPVHKWLCPCDPRQGEAWDEIRASCLLPRLRKILPSPNWGCLMPTLALIAFWCVVVGMGWIILFRSCVLPWAWYCQ